VTAVNRRSATYPIVITGIGPTCPEYFTVAELLAAPHERAGEPARSMAHFQPERFLGKRGFKSLSPATRYALAAAHVALDDAGLLDTAIYPPESKGVFVGTNFAVHDVLETMDGFVLSQGASALFALETPNFSVNIPASHISMKLGFLAFNVTLTSMLVAGVEAVMLGAESIRNGRAKLVLAGATEGGMPTAAAALFGAPPSDGAACMLALEALPAAQSRGARIYAQVGPSLLCFIPPDVAGTYASWAPHEQRLRRALDGLLGDAKPLRLATFDLGCAFTQRVNESVLRYWQDHGLSLGLHACAAAAADASVSPLLSLSASVARHGDALLLVASPQGHVALLWLEPLGGGRV